MSTGLVTREALNSVEQLEGVLKDVEQRIATADYSTEMTALQLELARDERVFFETESDPDGEKWTVVAPSTAQRKRHPRILFKSGALMESLIHIGGAGNISQAESRSLLFGTSAGYAAFHQDGTSRMPARSPVGVTEERVDQLADQIANASVERMKLTTT